MVDDDKADRPDVDWTVHLSRVERLDCEEGDEGEQLFSVEFALSGPGVNGTISARVTDPASEETIVTEGFDMLLVGLEELAAAARLSMKPIPPETA